MDKQQSSACPLLLPTLLPPQEGQPVSTASRNGCHSGEVILLRSSDSTAPVYLAAHAPQGWEHFLRQSLQGFGGTGFVLSLLSTIHTILFLALSFSSFKNSLRVSSSNCFLTVRKAHPGECFLCSSLEKSINHHVRRASGCASPTAPLPSSWLSLAHPALHQDQKVSQEHPTQPSFSLLGLPHP